MKLLGTHQLPNIKEMSAGVFAIEKPKEEALEYMKKFIIKVLVFALILGIVFIPINVCIDPYNIFHVDNVRDNGVEPNKNYIKTKYVLENPDKFDSFLFGSSRAGFMDVTYLSELTGERWYDMASSEALPYEHVNTLKVFIKNGIVPKSVCVLVDDISCFVDPKTHENMLYRVPYPTGGPLSFADFYIKYCDLFTTAEAIKVISGNEDPDLETAERFRETGTERLDIETYFDPTLPQFQTGYYADYYSLRLEEAISDMEELVNICKDNNIKLTVITNPLYYLTYERSCENGYLQFIEELAKVTGFYNFSCLSDINNNYLNYYETSHFTPEVGRMMLEMCYSDKTDDDLRAQGFGFFANEYNIGNLMEILNRQLQ